MPTRTIDDRADLVRDALMARKREPVQTSWGRDRLMQYVAEQLIAADEEVVLQVARERGWDVQTLKAWIDGAKSRRS